MSSVYGTVPAGRNLWFDPRPVGSPPNSSASPVSASVLRVTDRSFSGSYSYYVSGLAAGSSITWQAAPDNNAVYSVLNGGKYLSAAIRLSGNAQISAAIRINYTDGAWAQTPPVVVTPGTSLNFVTATLETTTDPTKAVKNVQWWLTNNTGSAISFYFAGADLRTATPVDAFIHGDAGANYAWEGTVNASASTRDMYIIPPVLGYGGQFTPTITVEVISRQGATLRDITSHFLDGSVTYDLDADGSKGSCSLTLDEPKLVEVLGDEWVRVSLRVDYPDGTSEEGPVGVFILDPPKERWNEGRDEWQYTGRDILSLLTTTTVRGAPMFLQFGTDEETVLTPAYGFDADVTYRAAIENILQEVVGLVPSQYSFSGALSGAFDSNTLWESGTTAFKMVDDILQGAGWQSPWATPGGIVTSAPAGVNPALVTPSLTLATGQNSKLRWPFEVDPDASAIGNRVRVISARDVVSVTHRRKKRKKKKSRGGGTSTTRHAVEVWRMNNDLAHPLSYPRLGRWIDIPDVTQPLVSDEAEANALADQALIDAGNLPIRVRLTTIATVRGLNEVYELDMMDAYGEPIESGQGRYWCRGWSLQLGPPWEMVHNLSRVIDFKTASFVSG